MITTIEVDNPTVSRVAAKVRERLGFHAKPRKAENRLSWEHSLFKCWFYGRPLATDTDPVVMSNKEAMELSFLVVESFGSKEEKGRVQMMRALVRSAERFEHRDHCTACRAKYQALVQWGRVVMWVKKKIRK